MREKGAESIPQGGSVGVKAKVNRAVGHGEGI